MKYYASLLLIFTFLAGCKREKICDCIVPYQVYYLKAKVVETSDITCLKPVLDFSEDSLRIQHVTGLDSVRYNVLSLPDIYNVKGTKLYVSVVLLSNEEKTFFCNTLGITLPRIKIVDAKLRN